MEGRDAVARESLQATWRGDIWRYNKMMRNLLSRRVDFWSLRNSELVAPLDSLSSSSSFSDDVDKVEHEEADARNED
ncbi:unnamed protein product [Sphagnum jensenii]|uniref:Uncharacterized protein n=1 Tax=Sphagnum jensenii TaxID=128206 RepID=A0ABP1BWG7_9BRYO